VKITAVIPVHNRTDRQSRLLDRLLATIREQTLQFADIVIVNNASSEDVRRPGCRVIDMGENAGFARAVNSGWRAAKTEWVAILNSDVELDGLWAEQMKESVATAAFATGLILSAANRETVDGTYDLLSRAGCAWRAGHGLIAAGNHAQAIAVAPGTALLFRRDVLERLNGFDEGFGSYLEDVDLGLRCLRAGFGGVFVPGAVAWHHGSATLGRWNSDVVRLISRNQLRLVARHYDRALFRACFRQIVVGQLLWGLVALRHGAFGAWLAGKAEGLRDFRLQADHSPGLLDFLNASEREIRARSQDSYWRWYFRLAGPSSTKGH
jgi:GT2 family glycosyltransferase